jgi:hypothetical protein
MKGRQSALGGVILERRQQRETKKTSEILANRPRIPARFFPQIAINLKQAQRLRAR